VRIFVASMPKTIFFNLKLIDSFHVSSDKYLPALR